MRDTKMVLNAVWMLLAALHLTPAFAGEIYAPFGLSCTRDQAHWARKAAQYCVKLVGKK